MAQLNESGREKIEAPNLAFLATVMEDGSPQVSPVWIAMEDDKINFNRKPGEARLKVIVEPRVVAR